MVTQETAIVGGTVLTMDDSQPRAEAILIKGNRIMAVGPRASVMREVSGPASSIIDLRGRTVAPGFNDAHIHLTQLGERERALDLTGLSKAEILEQVRTAADARKPRELVAGYNWDYPTCPDPHRGDLDAICPDRPVLLFQFSGHGAWVNSRTLAMLHLDRNSSDWQMGGADRDENGELTGVIREPGQAPRMKLFFLRHMGKPSGTYGHLVSAMATIRERGITSAQDNTWFPWVVSALRKLNSAGEQTCRLSCWSPGFIRPLDAWFSLKRFDEQWYRFGPRKFFIDGAFSSHTAWLTEPYHDQPDTSGGGLQSSAIEPLLRRATRQGRQIAFHSIGDAATRAYLNAMENVGGRALQLRHRIEHGQLIRDRDIERIARLGMVTSCQPHAAATPEKDRSLLGEERAQRAYPYRSLLDAGVRVAFGSDYPGEATCDPLYGIHLAVNRKGGEAISAEEALRCYTAHAAWAEFQEGSKGKLRPSFLADMVVLSADPTAVEPGAIKDITVDATMVDGKIVYTRTDDLC